MSEPSSHGEIVELLGRVAFFGGCAPAELAHLASTATAVVFEPDETICVQGAESPECYVIVHGEARVELEGQVLAVVGTDDVVGERGPLLGRTRSATVTAATHLLAYAISGERLNQVLSANEDAAAVMARVVAERDFERAGFGAATSPAADPGGGDPPDKALPDEDGGDRDRNGRHHRPRHDEPVEDD